MVWPRTQPIQKGIGFPVWLFPGYMPLSYNFSNLNGGCHHSLFLMFWFWRWDLSGFSTCLQLVVPCHHVIPDPMGAWASCVSKYIVYTIPKRIWCLQWKTGCYWILLPPFCLFLSVLVVVWGSSECMSTSELFTYWLHLSGQVIV